ncbi:MAG: hypothetical protein ACK5SX_14130 [Sandaracinobacter sp.]
MDNGRQGGEAAVVHAGRGGLTPPPGIDAPALNALLIGGIQQLVLASATMGSLAGLPLAEDRNWIRARLALRALIRSGVSTAPAGPGRTRCRTPDRYSLA